MKESHLSCPLRTGLRYGIAATALLAICASPAAAFAIAFASDVFPQKPQVAPGEGLEVQYFLNEPADSVVIELADNGTTAATFSGPTAEGLNKVLWNGRADNAAGPVVSNGTWRIFITATKTRFDSTEIASQRSLAAKGPSAHYSQVFSPFATNDCIAVPFQDSPLYGKIIATVSIGSTKTYGGFLFQPNLKLFSSSGQISGRTWVPPSSVSGDSGFEGVALDPVTKNDIYFSGQSSPRFMGGQLDSPMTAGQADPFNMAGTAGFRSVVIRAEADGKYAYLVGADSKIRKALFHHMETHRLTSSTVLADFGTTETFLKGLAFDDDGNLYLVSRYADSNSSTGGKLFRWNKEKVDNASVESLDPLTASNADWQISMPDTIINISGPVVTPDGNVYFASAVGMNPGIYHAGHASTPSVNKIASLADRVVSFDTVGTPAMRWDGSPRYFNLASDAAGNLIAVDRATEQIRIFAPPGTTSRTTRSVTAATITVTSSVSDWALY